METDTLETPREPHEPQPKDSMDQILEAYRKSFEEYPTNELLEAAVKNGLPGVPH